MLTNHLADMRTIAHGTAPRDRGRRSNAEYPGACDRQAYNTVLDAMADFRAVHYGWAQEYIDRWTDDPRGTGGTPYMERLRQLIGETRAFKIVSLSRR
jgi:indoleamine 2,3-dioxygenase